MKLAFIEKSYDKFPKIYIYQRVHSL